MLRIVLNFVNKSVISLPVSQSCAATSARVKARPVRSIVRLRLVSCDMKDPNDEPHSSENWYIVLVNRKESTMCIVMLLNYITCNLLMQSARFTRKFFLLQIRGAAWPWM